ncbi:MAG: alpha-L-rhamnosidase N-terminal domain-containing protein [Gemmatimonadota bacterium]|nr:alpha-L-rhamnosidase N-terminal domain-containing protein [Gemmatimonadota bacterium]
MTPCRLSTFRPPVLFSLVSVFLFSISGLCSEAPSETPAEIESELCTEVLEPSPALLERSWEASWIAPPDRDLTTYGVFHFRKRFELSERPAEFIVHVSADNRYKLYINGRQVADGPARGDLQHWRFETVDLAEFLRKGDNVIAAVVWNYGKDRPMAQFSHSTGFVLQGATGREAVLNTDESWKVLESKAYSPIPLDKEKIRVYTVVGPGDRLDGTVYQWDWNERGFDDSSWPRAVKVSRATPRGIQDGGSNWMLVPRTIPPMEKKLEPSPVVRKTKGIEVSEDFFKLGQILDVPAGSSVWLLLDQTYLTTAYPEIVVSGGKNANVTLTYAEALMDIERNKGERDEIEGKKIIGYKDEFIIDGEKKRLLTTLWFRTFRYLLVEIETAGQPLSIESVYSRFVAYPFIQKARFSSEDHSLSEIFATSWRTARLCAGETYFDCPYYEQLNYVGDTRIQALISLYVSGDDRMMRKALTLFDDSRTPDGLTQSRYPSHVPQVIPPYSLFWIAMLHDYWMLREDDRFVRSLMPGVRSVIRWFEQHLTENGLLGKLPWWNFVDWSEGYENGVCPGAKDGETSVISLQYAYVLDYAAELAEYFDESGEAERYRALASMVRRAVLEHCWSEDRGLIAETPEKRRFSQHANTMAILTDLIPADRQEELFDKIISERDLIQCTFYYKYYLHRALVKVGRGDRYLEMLQPWHDMLDLGLTTFAEKPEPTRSDCHAWSASPMLELLRTVAGIRPASPGFKSVIIEPNMGKLLKVVANVPHPLGDIVCQLRMLYDDSIMARIQLPEGLYGTFIWGGKKVPLHPGDQTVGLP